MEDFARYLAAKRTVDDRALNGRVWRRLSEELKSYPGAELALVDVGAGIGTGAERIIRSDLTTARYYSVGVTVLLITLFFIFVRLVEATGPAVV